VHVAVGAASNYGTEGFCRRPKCSLRHHTEQVEHWLAGMTRAVLRGLLTRWVAPVKQARLEQAGLNARRRSA
jgi:hypothetical protein